MRTPQRRSRPLAIILLLAACTPASADEQVTLFNGKDLTGWRTKGGEPDETLKVGSAKVNPSNPRELLVDGQGGDLINFKGGARDFYTEAEFGDATIEVEFMVPKGSNSGVYVMGEYEIQILDSFGKEKVGPGDVGGLYGAQAPRVNAAKAPGQWQKFVIDFRAPRFDDAGNKIADASFVKVTLNGKVIHENVAMTGPTPGGLSGRERPRGPLMFQGNHGPVAYRNIKVKGLGADAQPAVLDLDDQQARQVVVDREAGQYLGHPTTCLLEDGKTILCVYPRGHGRGAIVYKRSTDGGLTWSDRLPTPASWATSKEVPTLHRVIGPDGKKRIIMWSGLYPARLAVTEDDGATWSELKPAGDWGGIVVMGFVEAMRTGKGHYLAMFHDDGRFFSKDGKRSETFKLYKTFSRDGGLTWSFPEVVFQSSDVHLCEPGCIRSPDGERLAVLLRENARRKNSHVIFSDDEGRSWSEPRELPLALTGDRHTGKYGPDGRLLISFRCISPSAKRTNRPFEGDWVAWVGRWEDLVQGCSGQYFVRLKDNTKSYDTSYPGVEVLPDGALVATTYGHWTKGEAPYILSIRLKLAELDQLQKAKE